VTDQSYKATLAFFGAACAKKKTHPKNKQRKLPTQEKQQ
jgi:hypothetical protein